MRNNEILYDKIPTKCTVKVEHTMLLDMLNSGYSREEILIKLPKLVWCLFNDGVYDLTYF